MRYSAATHPQTYGRYTAGLTSHRWRLTNGSTRVQQNEIATIVTRNGEIYMTPLNVLILGASTDLCLPKFGRT